SIPCSTPEFPDPVNLKCELLLNSTALPQLEGAFKITLPSHMLVIMTGFAAVPLIFIILMPVRVPLVKQILSPGFTPFFAPSNCHSDSESDIIKSQSHCAKVED